MQAKSTCQFPDTLDGIEVGTIRRQKVEPKPGHSLLSPSLMQERVMILRVVDNDDHLFTAPKTSLAQLL